MHHNDTRSRFGARAGALAACVVSLAACAYGGADAERLGSRDGGRAAADAGGRGDAQVADAGGRADAGGLADAGRADAGREDAGVRDASLGADVVVPPAVVCGEILCGAGEVCVYPCCGGPAPVDCAPDEPCPARVDVPCTPAPPFCAPAVVGGCTGRDTCVPCGGLGLYDPVGATVSCICA